MSLPGPYDSPSWRRSHRAASPDGAHLSEMTFSAGVLEVVVNPHGVGWPSRSSALSFEVPGSLVSAFVRSP